MTNEHDKFLELGREPTPQDIPVMLSDLGFQKREVKGGSPQWEGGGCTVAYGLKDEKIVTVIGYPGATEPVVKQGLTIREFLELANEVIEGVTAGSKELSDYRQLFGGIKHLKSNLRVTRTVIGGVPVRAVSVSADTCSVYASTADGGETFAVRVDGPHIDSALGGITIVDESGVQLEQARQAITAGVDAGLELKTVVLVEAMIADADSPVTGSIAPMLERISEKVPGHVVQEIRQKARCM